MNSKRITSSFRDPSGYVFLDEDLIKRVIHPIYFEQYNKLTDKGFYTELFKKKYLIPHSEISRSNKEIIINAEKIPFISYPYEWSFLQYKHAALLTLKIQKLCLENNFTLKDASAFNITFHNGKPIFIDSLSFDFYQENKPWLAYKQFITHFLGPLVLSHYYGLDFLKTLSSEIDGISLKKLSKLLPIKSYCSPTILTNIHLLAKYDTKYAKTNKEVKSVTSKKSQLKLIDSLYIFIQNLKQKNHTEWDNYYNQTNYNQTSYQKKKDLTYEWLQSINGKKIIDIGGNDGTFSRELLNDLDFAIVPDIDPNAVEQNYKKILKNKEKKNIPLVIDILNPSSNYGFNNQERFSFIKRIKTTKLDGCLALAVIHHISLSGNIPFQMSASFFAELAPELLLEFPTREDSWVKFLLESKRGFKEHFHFYNETNFEKEYTIYFDIIRKESITESNRILYFLKRKTVTFDEFEI